MCVCTVSRRGSALLFSSLLLRSQTCTCHLTCSKNVQRCAYMSLNQCSFFSLSIPHLLVFARSCWRTRWTLFCATEAWRHFSNAAVLHLNLQMQWTVCLVFPYIKAFWANMFHSFVSLFKTVLPHFSLIWIPRHLLQCLFS